MNYPNWARHHDLLVRLCAAPHTDLTAESIEVIGELEKHVQFLENIHARQQDLTRATTAEHDKRLAALIERAKNAERTVDRLESLRPIWAMGYSNDSVAAQASSAALGSLWDMMGVSSQSEAIATLKYLLDASKADTASTPATALDAEGGRMAKAELASLVANLRQVLEKHERSVSRECTPGHAAQRATDPGVPSWSEV